MAMLFIFFVVFCATLHFTDLLDGQTYYVPDLLCPGCLPGSGDQTAAVASDKELVSCWSCLGNTSEKKSLKNFFF